jgi:hypothetical protein
MNSNIDKHNNMDWRYELKQSSNGKYGLYDNKQEEWLSDSLYDQVKKPIAKDAKSTLNVLFSKLVSQEGKWGVFSVHPKRLSIVIPCEYEEILYDWIVGVDGLWLLKKDGKWGAYSIYRKQIIVPFKYCDVDEVIRKCEEIEKSKE